MRKYSPTVDLFYWFQHPTQKIDSDYQKRILHM